MTGGHVLSLEELDEIAAWATTSGRRIHLDGARLWEAAAALGVDPGDVARRFDSVYVSFYKALGAPSGAALAGDRDFVEKARSWRKSLGGEMQGMWRIALPVRHALRSRLPLMPAWHSHASAIAMALNAENGLATAVPEMPSTLLHVLYDDPPQEVARALLETSLDKGIWGGRTVFVRPGTNVTAVEVQCYSNIFAMPVEDVVDFFREVRDRI